MAPGRSWIAILRAGLIVVCLSLIGTGTIYAMPPYQDPTPSLVNAVVAVERAIVFPQPDRNADALTYLYQRERVLVHGQSPDGLFLFVPVGNLWGWVLAAQVDIEGDLAAVPVITESEPVATPTMTITPFQASPAPTMGDTFPTRTPLPTQTPTVVVPDSGSVPDPVVTPTGEGEDAMPLLPGVPPPIDITIPEDWQAAHVVVPYRTFDGQFYDAPLSIYFGQLAPGVNGFIYLYWGFPNTVDYITLEPNFWADGVQILRGSLFGETCNLGVYDQQTFEVGGVEGVGAPYQAAECDDEKDTAGWFSVMQVRDGTFAFYVAVEPWDARADYGPILQTMLDSVVFFPPDAQDD